MYRSLNFPFAFFLFFQAAVSEWPVCDAVKLSTSTDGPFRLLFRMFDLYLQAALTPPSPWDTGSLLVRPSGSLTLPSALYFDNATRQSSVITATSKLQNSRHRVGIIVGACLGVTGAILLVGLILFWLLLRHRRSTCTATAEVENVGARSWAPRDILGCHGVAVIANYRSRSIDLAGADTDTASVAPASDETSETKQWNKSTEVLDISMENGPRSPLPPLPLPEPEPIEPSIPIPPLSIHTDIQAALSPPSSHSTSAGPSRFSIRPLPTPPTRAQVRRHRSAKADEAHRESTHRRLALAHRKFSADYVQTYVHDNRWSTAHSEKSMCCDADGCRTLQHHNGGMNARTDFPPPYSES